MNHSAHTNASANVFRHPHVERLEALSHSVHLLIGRIEQDPSLPLLKRRNPSITGVLERAAGRLEGTLELRTPQEVQGAVAAYEGMLRELARVWAILGELQPREGRGGEQGGQQGGQCE